MTITITPANPGARVGPGLPLGLASNLLGAVSFPGHWLLSLDLPSVPFTTVASWSWPATAKTTTIIHSVSPLSVGVGSTVGQGLSSDANYTGVVQLLDSTGANVDQGQLPLNWDPVAGLPLAIEQAAKQTGQGGGLTSEESQQLQELWQAQTPVISLDDLTLQPMSAGPVGGTVSAQLPDVSTGVLVRIATIPPDFVSVTPDEDYFFPSLAVISLFRGQDLWHRVPVHTSSKLYYWFDQNLVTAAATLTLTQWLLNMSVQVAFRSGVTGQAFLLKFP